MDVTVLWRYYIGATDQLLGTAGGVTNICRCLYMDVAKVIWNCGGLSELEVVEAMIQDYLGNRLFPTRAYPRPLGLL